MQGNPGIASSSGAPESEYPLDKMLRRKVDPYSGQRTNSFLWQTDFLLGREMIPKCSTNGINCSSKFHFKLSAISHEASGSS